MKKLKYKQTYSFHMIVYIKKDSYRVFYDDIKPKIKIEKYCCNNMIKISNSVDFFNLEKCPFCSKEITIVKMYDFDCFEEK